MYANLTRIRQPFLSGPSALIPTSSRRGAWQSSRRRFYTRYIVELTALRQAARAANDAALRARVERDLRYWSARRASARVVGPAALTERVRFGMRVTLQLGSGARQAFRLVGEDEADAAQGLLSWMAPLAQSLLGRQAGDTVPYQGVEAQILSIES